MSRCISREGEYSEHELGVTDTNRGAKWTCRRCWMLDEDALLDALTDAEQTIARVEALAGEFDRSVIGTDFFGNPIGSFVPVARLRAVLHAEGGAS